MRTQPAILGFIGLLTSSLVGACTLNVPPPMIAPHAGGLRPAAGSSTVQVIGGIAGQVIFGDPGAGLDLRYQYQLSDDFAIGASGVAGVRLPDDESCSDEGMFGCDNQDVQRLLAGRLYARYHPGGVRWAMLQFGLGGGSLRSDLGYLTLDTSAVLSLPLFREIFEPYLGLHLAASHPFGGFLATHPDSEEIDLCDTFYGGVSLGFLIHFTGQLGWSVDISYLAGTARDAQYLSLGTGLRFDF